MHTLALFRADASVISQNKLPPEKDIFSGMQRFNLKARNPVRPGDMRIKRAGGERQIYSNDWTALTERRK